MAVSDQLPGFDDERHDAYVALGYCPSVDTSKAYCCQQEGHGGQHFSLRLLLDGRFVIGTRWD
jgi:hypothetical protein